MAESSFFDQWTKHSSDTQPVSVTQLTATWKSRENAETAFVPHLPLHACTDAFFGVFHVDDADTAHVAHGDRTVPILGTRDRNRALHGDLVAVDVAGLIVRVVQRTCALDRIPGHVQSTSTGPVFRPDNRLLPVFQLPVSVPTDCRCIALDHWDADDALPHGRAVAVSSTPATSAASGAAAASKQGKRKQRKKKVVYVDGATPARSANVPQSRSADTSKQTTKADVAKKETTEPKHASKSKASKKGEKGKEKKKWGKNKKKKKGNFHSKHLSQDEMLKGLQDKTLHRGEIRVNAKRSLESFVSVDGYARDIYIDGNRNRNRAFHGDVVCLRIQSEPQDATEEEPRYNGKVVGILEARARRTSIVGYLTNISGKGDELEPAAKYRFIPQDTRVPLASCVVADQDPKLVSNLDVLGNSWVTVDFQEWDHTQTVSDCILTEIVGKRGNMPTEIRTLLIKHDINHTGSFEDDVVACLNEFEGGVPKDAFASRLDLRDTLITSIDPITAKDLDDALSVAPLPDGRFRVGVHIADVAHYIRPGSALDEEARFRATSVYLKGSVIPMLPRLLCEDLCSLNPGVDRLAHSVFFTVSAKGKPDYESATFAKTVIRTRAKLDYGTAQRIIDGEEVDVDSEIQQSVRQLHVIADGRRKLRFQGGALNLDSPDLFFQLEADNLYPTGVVPYERGASHFLVEEMMLLANEMAARRLSSKLPQSALLRHHPAPLAGNLERLAEICARFGYTRDLKTAGDIQAALQALKTHECVQSSLASPGAAPVDMATVLDLSFTKLMSPAAYFCTDLVEPKDWNHFNLNLGYYTHFTSPIRRYADLIVHRQLAAVGIEEGSKTYDAADAEAYDADTIAEVVGICNVRNAECRYLDQDMDVLYLAVLAGRHPERFKEERAILVDVGTKSFKVYLVRFGVEQVVFCQDIVDQCKAHVCDVQETEEGGDKTVRVQWTPSSPMLEINMFEELSVTLSKKPGLRSALFALLIPPPQEESNDSI